MFRKFFLKIYKLVLKIKKQIYETYCCYKFLDNLRININYIEIKY